MTNLISGKLSKWTLHLALVILTSNLKSSVHWWAAMLYLSVHGEHCLRSVEYKQLYTSAPKWTEQSCLARVRKQCKH